jgi:hypothetical protein
MTRPLFLIIENFGEVVKRPSYPRDLVQNGFGRKSATQRGDTVEDFLRPLALVPPSDSGKAPVW